MSNGHDEKLTRKQEKAIVALLTTGTLAKAAEQAGIAERTLRYWLKLDDFVAAYRSARRQAVEQAIAQLQHATGAAVRSLRRNLNCGHPATEIRAALGILDQSLKAVEMLELETRLTALENRQRTEAIGANANGQR